MEQRKVTVHKQYYYINLYTDVGKLFMYFPSFLHFSGASCLTEPCLFGYSWKDLSSLHKLLDKSSKYNH